MRQTKNNIVILFVLLTLLLIACGGHNSAAHREAEVAARGEMVMPFDLERTTHIFNKQAAGGLQQVVSDDGDAEQIQLIRDHLQEEAVRFQAGDFHDPAMIHGEDMAGLHELVAGAAKLSIVYSEIDDGAQISYSAEESELVAALHDWFEQQVADHGSHAEGH